MVEAWSGDGLIDRLLEPALRYATDAASAVPFSAVDNPTPCEEWSVGDLSGHLLESLQCLTTSLNFGVVASAPTVTCRRSDFTEFEGRLRHVARRVHAAARRRGPASISVDGLEMDRQLVVVVAAVEASIHAWDLLAGAGLRQELPDTLARAIQRVLPAVVGPSTRGPEFAPPVAAPEPASPSDRVLVALGRSPRW